MTLRRKDGPLDALSVRMADANDWINSIPFELTDSDRQNLIAGDEKFVPHTWEDLKTIIGRTIYL